MTMIVRVKIEKEVDIKVVTIQTKSCDKNSITFYDADKNVIADIDECYVPSFIPDGGDYINLIIDIETGQILNWKQIKPTQIEQFIEDNS